MSFVQSPAPRLPFALSATSVGMLAMTMAMILLPMADTLSKVLTGILPPLEVTALRLGAQTGVLTLCAALLHRHQYGPVLSRGSVLSGLCLAVSVASLTCAFAVMPIATAIAIFFVEPVILTCLAAVLLGERPDRRKITAVGLGLAGAMIVIRPGFSAYGWATLLPVISAFAFALNMVVLRRTAGVASGLRVQVGATLVATLLVGGTALALPGTPAVMGSVGGWVWLAVLGAGGLAAASYALIGEAFRRADAGVLAPLQYLEILGATALGAIVFGDLPDALTWIGIGLILASGVYVARNGLRLTSRRAR